MRNTHELPLRGICVRLRVQYQIYARENMHIYILSQTRTSTLDTLRERCIFTYRSNSIFDWTRRVSPVSNQTNEN